MSESEIKSEETRSDGFVKARKRKSEFGLNVTIDWRYLFVIPIILLVIYFSTANAIAYQNVTMTRENLVQNSKYKDNEAEFHVEKLNGKFKSFGMKIHNDTDKITEVTSRVLPADTDSKNASNCSDHRIGCALDQRETTTDPQETTTDGTTVEYDSETTTEFVTTETTPYFNSILETTTFEFNYTDTTLPMETTLQYETTTNRSESIKINSTKTDSLKFNNTITKAPNLNVTKSLGENLNCSKCAKRNNANLQKNPINAAKINESERIEAVKKVIYGGDEKESAENTEDYDMSYENRDYEDKKTTEAPPKPGPLDAIRDMAGTLIESIYERYVPKSLRDIFKRMQEQNEKLETIRLRSREENGGIGQFGRSILKGLTGPLNQIMQGVRDYGSLDSDQNFFAGVASGVVSVADSVADAFKDRVRAIYPGTLWCGDGDMARSAEVGLFYMTDNCCKNHDACKLYILTGETKYGLTNTGLFTRSHCECDRAFFRCLKRTNSLISSQIGLTYFSILGPQCFKKEHPIMRCKRRTRYTGQKCEEYELDYSQPKMWQWFDTETF